jgi:hypothetical protein
MSMRHTTIRGRIRYTSNKPERLGQERGREHFTITVHTDGSRTLRAVSEIDDPPAVLRDVTLSVGPDWQPRDAFVRLTVDDRFAGSSWFRFDGFSIECEGYTAREGRISQRLVLEGPPCTFGAHPIQGDAWHLNIVDLSRGPHWQIYPRLVMSSLDHRGATGPMLVRHPIGLRLAFVGRERLSIAAGTFDALHFRYGPRPGEEPADTANTPTRHPPYEIWCTDDGHYVFLKGEVGGYMMTAYELVELDR